MKFHVSILWGFGFWKSSFVRLLLFIGILISLYVTIFQILVAQVDTERFEYNTIQAKENFRLGVNAFNYGFYSRAIVALEYSLALRPENPDAIFWLGRSYYASGYMRLGLDQWQTLIDQNQAKASLKSFYNTLDYRYRQISKLSTPDQYSLFMKLESHKKSSRRSAYFVGPTSVRTSQDRDEIYVVDYQDNKVVALDSSGATRSLFRGSLKEVYDHPFDILLRPRGKGFILSQAGTNSLLFCDERGYPYKEVGSKGNASDQFLGPQHLLDSGDGYFYVTDWGNRRIAKLDYDGNFIFTFGGAQRDFSGLQGPTGMIVHSNKIYVADMLQQKIFVFNQEGRYLETFISSGLESPEALLESTNGNILIADNNEIKLYDFDQLGLKTIYAGDRNQKYVNLDYDQNLNIVAVDFKNEKIDFVTPVNKLYTDLFVQIDRVVTSDYPRISVDLLVEGREGTPIVGLGKRNFEIVENNKIQPSDLIYTGITDSSVALAIVLGSNISGYKDIVRQLAASVEKKDGQEDSFMLIQGGKTPRVLTTSIQDVDDRFNSYKEFKNDESPEINFDVSLRFALDSLVQSRKKKIIVFVSGDAERIAAETYNISDLNSYLNLENAKMYGVISTENKIVSYLVNNTGGKLYSNANIRGFTQDIQRHRSELTGYYTLNFTSTAETDLARRYIPVEVVVRYVRRSGKDELGFFAPLSSINGR